MYLSLQIPWNVPSWNGVAPQHRIQYPNSEGKISILWGIRTKESLTSLLATLKKKNMSIQLWLLNIYYNFAGLLIFYIFLVFSFQVITQKLLMGPVSVWVYRASPVSIPRYKSGLVSVRVYRSAFISVHNR